MSVSKGETVYWCIRPHFSVNGGYYGDWSPVQSFTVAAYTVGETGPAGGTIISVDTYGDVTSKTDRTAHLCVTVGQSISGSVFVYVVGAFPVKEEGCIQEAVAGWDLPGDSGEPDHAARAKSLSVYRATRTVVPFCPVFHRIGGVTAFARHASDKLRGILQPCTSIRRSKKRRLNPVDRACSRLVESTLFRMTAVVGVLHPPLPPSVQIPREDPHSIQLHRTVASEGDRLPGVFPQSVTNHSVDVVHREEWIPPRPGGGTRGGAVFREITQSEVSIDR